MSIYRRKSFAGDGNRPETPRHFGMTEIRCPHYSIITQKFMKDIFATMGRFFDGLKFSGGSHSLLPKSLVKEVTAIAHNHNVYVSTGDWAEHLIKQRHSAFKEYVEECKQLGFDTIELNAGSLEVPEETLLRFVRMIKSGGLKAKPQFSVMLNKSYIPNSKHRAYGAYIVPQPRSSVYVEDVDLMIKRAKRCLEAGADMIMINSGDVCRDTIRTDIIAKVVGRLGLEKIMFESSNFEISEWFIQNYGPKVNLFVNPSSQVMDLERLRGRHLGKDHASVLRPSKTIR